MSLPLLEPPSSQSNAIASRNFAEINYISRNKEGKNGDLENIRTAMLKLDELDVGQSIEDSDRDMIPNLYQDDEEESK